MTSADGCVKTTTSCVNLGGESAEAIIRDRRMAAPQPALLRSCKLSEGSLAWSRRRGSNPHGTKYHWILSPARLPVPPLRDINSKIARLRSALKASRHFTVARYSRDLYNETLALNWVSQPG